jgi:hypothetical protein
MPEEPTVQTPEAADVETTDAEVETPTPEDVPKPTPKPAETVDFWKAKAREQEKRAKENAAKAAEFDKVTDAQKTEQQKLLERAEAAEKERDAERALREIDGWKTQVAKDPKYAGLTADVLRGSTLEEIEDHAASLKALLPEPRRPGQVPGEGRTVNTGSGDPATQFAELIKNARRG